MWVLGALKNIGDFTVWYSEDGIGFKSSHQRGPREYLRVHIMYIMLNGVFVEWFHLVYACTPSGAIAVGQQVDSYASGLFGLTDTRHFNTNVKPECPG